MPDKWGFSNLHLINQTKVFAQVLTYSRLMLNFSPIFCTLKNERCNLLFMA